MITRHQRRARSFAPVSAVLNTPELLETIFSYLDQRTLLISAQRVSHYWRLTIINSPVLQRLLYFRPDPQPPVSAEETQGVPPCRVPNPLLKQAFPPMFVNTTMNETTLTGGRYRRDAVKEMSLFASPARQKAFLHPNASWRYMLVTQPPVLRLGCWQSDNPICGELPGERFKILHFTTQFPATPSAGKQPTAQLAPGDGLRMGKLYDLVIRWLTNPGNPLFAVHWTPHDVSTFRQRFFLHAMGPPSRDDPCLIACGNAVDVLLRGERWHGDCVRPMKAWYDPVFKRRYTFKCAKKDEKMSLEPVRDSGYKTVTEWMEIFEAAEAA